MKSTRNPITVHGMLSYYRGLYFCTIRVRMKLYTIVTCANSATLIMAGAWTRGVHANENIPRHMPPGSTLLPTVDHVDVAHPAMRSPTNPDRLAHFDRRIPITFSATLDDQARAEQTSEHSRCWVSVIIALCVSKLSGFKHVFDAPDHLGMNALHLFPSFVEAWEQLV